MSRRVVLSFDADWCPDWMLLRVDLLDQDRRVLPDDEWELLHKACLRRFGPVHDGWNMEG